MQDTNEIKGKILSFMKQRGPSLPVHISSQLKMSPIFAGAFLSELYNEKAILISNLRVGGSPLYYLTGQENALESFFKHLPEKEREAFLLLKDKKILEDKKQPPAIRVALRSIKDFAVPFTKDEDVFWRFHSVSEQEVRELIEPQIQPIRQIQPISQSVINKPEEKIEKIIEEPIEKINEPIKDITKVKISQPKLKKQEIEKFENPFVTEIQEKITPKSEFVIKALEKIKSRYSLIEEKNLAQKEYTCIVQVKSDLGPINFLAFAKDKKKLSETDLKEVLSEAQRIPLPALFLYNGEISKKALEYADKHFSILKVEKL
jgi:hypothetical protein